MTILLCSANGLVRQRWSSLLAGKYELLQAASLTELQTLLEREGGKGILLLHRPMVDMETTVAIRRRVPQCRIFLLTDRPDEEEGLSFLRLGIVGYANTYISAGRLVEAVRLVSSGSVWINQQLMQRLIKETATAVAREKEQVARSEQGEGRLATLSVREAEIARLVAKGMSNLEVAAELDITERTVKAHLSSIYTKTGTGSRLNLALLLNRGG
ncbi:MAG: response regulator transcription factor [Desulfobulbaceae bacterium]|nr:response regulator transcription factor [Desulfobulbaceae bacterium]